MPIREIKRKVDILRSYLEEMDRFLVVSDKDILADDIKLRAIERVFQLIVDEAVDINTLILADAVSQSPESYKSTFFMLADEKIIDRDLSEKISGSAKIRNQIVHDYEKILESDLIQKIKKFQPIYKEYLAVLIKKYF
jgi:uncharacterized protein YutE (UPF0331/DUF86 family)